jgi:outer membrane protein
MAVRALEDDVAMARPVRLAVLIMLLTAAPGALSAQSLNDALRVAYQTNPTIRAERARLRATEELKAQAWADALPQINAAGSLADTRNTQSLNPGVFGPGGSQTFDFNPLTGQVEGSMPVFDGFRNVNAIRQARARVRAGGAELASVEQTVLRNVAAAYFDVLRDQTIYESTVNNVEVLARQKRESDIRFEVGEITKTDVAQAEARLSQARANLASAQAQLAVSRARYAELVGAQPGDLDKAPALPEVPETLEAATTLARGYAPAVIAARERESASRRQISIARSAFLPTVSVTANYQYAEEPNTFVNSDETFSYGLRASVPLFTGGRNLSRVREARALHESAEHSVLEAERNVEAQVTSAWQQLAAARIAIQSARAEVAANELALDGVRREAQVGARSTLDVLNAEQELLNARVSLANAARNERVAAFDLLAAAGVLTLDAAGAPTLSGSRTPDGRPYPR